MYGYVTVNAMLSSTLNIKNINIQCGWVYKHFAGNDPT